jgi:hypothetical protein
MLKDVFKFKLNPVRFPVGTNCDFLFTATLEVDGRYFVYWVEDGAVVGIHYSVSDVEESVAKYYWVIQYDSNQ